jgi:hypothetical protein
MLEGGSSALACATAGSAPFRDLGAGRNVDFFFPDSQDQIDPSYDFAT